MKIIKIHGSKIVPCGTPQDIVSSRLQTPFICTFCLRSSKYDFIIQQFFSLIPADASFFTY